MRRSHHYKRLLRFLYTRSCAVSFNRNLVTFRGDRLPGFDSQAKSTARGLGLPNLPLAVYPGHVDLVLTEELRKCISTVVDQIVKALTIPCSRRSGGGTEVEGYRLPGQL
jgi:hypothetical protein